MQAERDYSACSLSSGDEFSCVGSSTGSPPRLQAADNDPASPTFSSEIGGARTFDPVTGADIPYVTAVNAYNFAPLNHYQRPDQRYTAGLFAHYEVAPSLDAYTEFQFMNDQTFSQVAPSGAFRLQGPGAGGTYIVNCDNPFLSAAQLNLFCTGQGLTGSDDALVSIAKRNVEGGGRQDHLQHTSYRAVLGARGDIGEAWRYDVYGLYGTTEFEENFTNDISKRNLSNALLAVDDGTGNIVCRVNADANLTNDDPACVPYNPFAPNGVTPGALGYISTPGFSAGSTTETIVSGSVTGELGQYGVKLPSASDGLAVAFGAEYRSEDSETRNDVEFQTNDLLGQGGAQLNIQGSYNVSEVFAEARLPLVQDKTFARELSLETGYRYSDYSLGFTTDTYKVGLAWAPVEDVRFRGSYQRAVRAPNIVELFRQNVVQLDGSTDPCAVDNPGVDTPSRSLAECQRTGVAAAQYGLIASNPSAQYNGLTGGTATLNPESSDTVSFGFVLTPRALEGFSLALDYFDIKVDDLIGVYGADLILGNCLDSGDPRWCSLVHRAAGSASLWSTGGYIVDTNVNTGSLQTKGIDLESNYRVNLGGNGGRLLFQLIGTYVDELVHQPVTGSPTYDCAGFYGLICGVPTPEFRSKFRTTWSSPWNLDVSLTWRYIDSVKLDTTSSDPQLAGEVFATDAKLKAENYLDLAASYNLKAGPAAMTLRLGINNLTDEDPPLVGQQSCLAVFCSGNTFPQMYDTLGRTVFMNVTADF